MRVLWTGQAEVLMFAHDRWTRASRRRGKRPTHHLRVADECIHAWVRWLLAAALFAVSHAAQAHGIVGNRVFPGTLAFDDPAVMDELVFPAVSSLKHPREGADVTDDRIGGSFTRLLTSTLSVGIESGWIHRNWGVAQRSGFDTTALTLKDLLYKSELHEVMISAGLAWGIGHSGAQGVGASKPDTIQPSIFFGKGFGDLPDGLAWLRPFAVTGAVTLEIRRAAPRQTSGSMRTPANSAPCSRAMSTRCTGDSRSSTACSISPAAIRPASFPRMNRCISSSPSLNLRSIRRAEKKPLPR